MTLPYFGLDGEPIDADEWIRLFHDHEGRRVGHDVVGDLEISTVWHGLGLGTDPPLIYETMVFREGRDVETWRHSSWEDAEEKHRELVEQAAVLGRADVRPA